MSTASKKTKNKGEWGEAYAIVNLALNKQIFACDRSLVALGGTHNYDINHITLNKAGDESKKITLSPSLNSIKATFDGKSNEITDNELQLISESILKKIKESTGTFEIPEVEYFWEKLFHPKLKSKSASKRDITVSLKNPEKGEPSEYGFSIKSDLGNKPSLLNASGATNFLFKAPSDFNPNPPTVEAKELGRAVKSLNLQLLGPVNEKYKSNLSSIDQNLSDLLSYILIEYYGSADSTSNLNSLLSLVEAANPLNISDVSRYKKILVTFLEATALGMVPNKVWNKTFDADGGILVIKKNGEIVSFYREDTKSKDELLEYLSENTLLETPSKTRHKFGKLETDKSFKLNLQIRTKD